MEDIQDRIKKVNIEEEMRSSYIDYSMSVIVSRALPDVRDGFKPVHRRVLYGMNELGLTYSKQTKKSARVVGHVLGKYHPHGDSSVYGTLVRMGQEWILRYPLVFGQGNFGSVDGDSPAAMRYTEAKLQKIAEEVMADLENNTYTFTHVTEDHTIHATFESVVSVDMTEEPSMSIHPNPNNGMFSIVFNGIEGNATYQLINAKGAVVETRDINVMNGATMNFNHNLTAGTYFVRIICGEKVYVEQIVVE